jgi:zinc protease
MMSGQNSVNIQTNDDYAGIYSVPELHGFGMDFHHETQSKIEELVYDDFQKDIEEFLSSKWTTVTVGR